jgi:hypothetical protein
MMLQAPAPIVQLPPGAIVFAPLDLIILLFGVLMLSVTGWMLFLMSGPVGRLALKVRLRKGKMKIIIDSSRRARFVMPKEGHHMDTVAGEEAYFTSPEANYAGPGGLRLSIAYGPLGSDTPIAFAGAINAMRDLGSDSLNEFLRSKQIAPPCPEDAGHPGLKMDFKRHLWYCDKHDRPFPAWDLLSIPLPQRDFYDGHDGDERSVTGAARAAAVQAAVNQAYGDGSVTQMVPGTKDGAPSLPTVFRWAGRDVLIEDILRWGIRGMSPAVLIAKIKAEASAKALSSENKVYKMMGMATVIFAIVIGAVIFLKALGYA